VTRARLWCSAAGAILQRDLRLLISYRFRLGAMMLNGLISVTLFHFISRLVHVSQFQSSEKYFAFVVVGLVILQVLNATVSSAGGSLRGEVSTGTFVRLLVSPFGAVSGLLAMLVFPVLTSLTIGIFILAIGTVLYGMPVEWSTVPLAIPTAFLGALAFTPFSILLLSITVQVKQAATAATWLTAGVGLVSGLYFPTSLLPAGIRWMADVQPFTPAADLLRHLLVGTPLADSAVTDLAKLVGFIVVLMPIAFVTLRASLRLAQRRGTVLEY
jgi:ABC-2 type transport system permease protein